MVKMLLLTNLIFNIGLAMPIYKVKKGDTLYKISKEQGIGVEELANYNRIDPDNIVIGQEIKIPSKVSYDYEDLVSSVELLKGVSRSNLESLMDNIAAWESDYKNKQDIITDAKQVGGGPGRGAFQFEIYDVNGQGQPAAITAANRLNNLYEEVGAEKPEWLKNLKIKYREPKSYKEAAENFNPADLTYEQQKMLFLGDALMASGGKGKPLEQLNEISPGMWWGQYHQTGNDPDKVKLFDKNVNERYAKQKGIETDYESPVSTSTASWVAG